MENKLEKKLTVSVLTIIILIICLTVTSLALIYATVTLENNLIKTGYIAISLNGGKPVITESEVLFAPGMTYEKEFYLENASPCSVWYRFYFDNVSGSLQDVLEVTILDGDTVLYRGTVADLTESASQAAPASEVALEKNEMRVFTILFYFPESAGNEAQGASLTFDFAADAVQTLNNPNRLFND